MTREWQYLRASTWLEAGMKRLCGVSGSRSVDSADPQALAMLNTYSKLGKPDEARTRFTGAGAGSAGS
jgi:hypothetical protein